MIRHSSLQHRFVEHFPDQLETGVLYVSFEFGSVAHSCCCGCGEEVVTPLTPTDWNITFDGETISLHPSVGNWTLPCRSHYVIRHGRVIEAPSWSEAEIAAERRRDRQAKSQYFGSELPAVAPKGPAQAAAAPKAAPVTSTQTWWQRLRRWWHGE